MSEKQIIGEKSTVKEEGKKTETETGNQLNTQSTEVTVQNDDRPSQSHTQIEIDQIE